MKRGNNRLTYILISLIILNVLVTGYLVFTLHGVTNDVNDIQDRQTELTKIVTHSINDSDQQTAQFSERTGYLPVHDEISNSGAIIEYTFQPTPGDKVYVSASDLPTAANTQKSFTDAKQAVENSEYEPEATGVTISIHKTNNWDNLHGRSGGLSFARMYASTDPDYTVNESVVLTGQVEPNGRIETVNYITQKARAAEQNGYDAIIVPKTYTSTTVNGIQIIQAGTLEEALDRSLDPANESAS